LLNIPALFVLFPLLFVNPIAFVTVFTALDTVLVTEFTAFLATLFAELTISVAFAIGTLEAGRAEGPSVPNRNPIYINTAKIRPPTRTKGA
jgi:hypothetical protein